MLRRGGLMMCGRGVLCPWGPPVLDWEQEGKTSCRTRWQRGGAGRDHRWKHGHQPYTRPRARSLRPVNMMGNRAPGMRAPRNTNQFLMSEKYQMLKLRSDSVGTECSGGSDSEMDPLDMDSYMGVLENAHGALLEHPESGVIGIFCSPSSSPSNSCWSPFQEDGDTRAPRRCDKLTPPTRSPCPFRGVGPLLELRGECSEQYFPSENDVIESENFMEKDFQEFCSRIA
ncbi:hypothetical protein XENTR_v10012574 [Xenopus tropicalis]|uniref:Uncharacterized protein LOC100487499 n=1 Tax=Xenopus tropicalis TaxID=8364 RepID=A0A8J0QPC7_XENTR|nr:uncharacterized protein LOC100487499 [Xenopus tropicalis]KAE8611721.1 hypothetical protein XENTR_v10012574 [Xenopus tropicalis]|eukprot:XP_002934274.1 PREDICTED: uncharacterized protein LOC100487499 [Xenopus tropicalis]